MPKIVPFRASAHPPALKRLEVLNKTAKSADLYMYDEIGPWGITASALAPVLSSLADREVINLHINSPGGSVFDGVAIYNMLLSHNADIHVFVDGLAASIASLIAMAGDQIHMAENAMMMVHNPWAIVAGNAKELRKQADVMDQIQQTLVTTYVSRTGQKTEDVQQLMDAETWLTAARAKELGFATHVDEAQKIAAKWDPACFSAYHNTPKTFVESEPAKEPAKQNRSLLVARREQLARLEKQQ